VIKSALSRLFAVLLGGSALSSCEGQAPELDFPENTLSVRLAVIDSVIDREAAFRFQYIVQNGTEQPVRLLPWGTPLEDRLTADAFDVTFNGAVLPYMGIMAKRMAPVAADYITLGAGESIEVTVDLSRAYDTASAGEYRVQLKTFGDAYHIESTEFTIASAPLVIERR
jgi:hypothetical protein